MCNKNMYVVAHKIYDLQIKYTICNYNLAFYAQSSLWTERSGGETLFIVYTLLAKIGYEHASPLTDIGKLFYIPLK